MGSLRSSYLRLITRSGGVGLPLIRPPNALLRRWELTATASPAVDLQTGSTDTSTQLSSLPAAASVFKPPRRPTSSTDSKPSPAKSVHTNAKEESVAAENASDVVDSRPAEVIVKESPKRGTFPTAEPETLRTKHIPGQKDNSQIAEPHRDPVIAVPAEERSEIPQLPQLRTRTTPTSTTAEPAPFSARDTTEVPTLRDVPPSATSSPSTTKVAPIESRKLTPVEPSHALPILRPLPPAIQPPLASRRDETASKSPSVSIGSLEVKILPQPKPPIKPRRAVTGSSSAAMMSRGFTTSFGLKQG